MQKASNCSHARINKARSINIIAVKCIHAKMQPSNRNKFSIKLPVYDASLQQVHLTYIDCKEFKCHLL